MCCKKLPLMILTQHPQGVAVDTENIFTVLKEALSNNSREYQQEKIDIFLRVVGVKLPYAKRSLTLEKQYDSENIKLVVEDFSVPDSSALTYSPIQKLMPIHLIWQKYLIYPIIPIIQNQNQQVLISN